MKTRRDGFTLIELLVVIAIIAFLVFVVASGIAAGKCTTLIKAIKDNISNCENVITNSGSSADVQQCIKTAQDNINKYCAECDKIGPTTTAVIDGLNSRIRSYRDGIEDPAEKAKILDLAKPAGC